MPPVNVLVFSVVVAEMILLATAGGVVGKSLTLTLERANHEGLELNQLKERDNIRHSRLLQQQSSSGIVNFPINGTYNPYLVGLYYTKVQLGTPPKEFYVQIDTGSDVLWVGCKPCIGCPLTSGLQIKLQFFDPNDSSTASLISCSDKRCALGDASSDSSCSIGDQCAYSFQYGDGSTTSGYYVSDLMNLNMIVGNSTMTSNSSAPVVFGCSALESGDLSNTERAVDGIFGFGQASLSVISQLSSQGITPRAFSHCLNGGNGGGGILVLGQVVDPNIVYTPLIPSQPHYNVDLQSIAVNGQKLSIDPSVFATSQETGTIVDSGTTLAYFPQEAYDLFVDTITQSVSQSVTPFVFKGTQCFLTNSSLSEAFPQVSLNFAGGVSMNLTPDDYLVRENTKHGEAVWCMGFQPIQGQGFTILGDLVLQNKIVVYDLADQKIGWVNYNCSSAVNVSTINGTIEFIDVGQNNNKSSAYHESYKLIQNVILCLFLHISFFGVLNFIISF